MSVGEYLKEIWRSWIVILTLTVLGGVAAFILSSSTPDTYRSTASVMLTSDRGTTTSELVQGSNYVEGLVSSYVILATSEIVLEPVVDTLSLDTTPQALARSISASSPLNSSIINIAATSRSPTLAQDIADEVTRSLTRVVTEDVSPTTADGSPTIRLTTIDHANLPKYPISPNTRVDVIVGILVGFAVGIVFAIVRALAWRTIHSREDVAQITSAPVIGELVEARRDLSPVAAILRDRRSVDAESVRSFAANLSFLNVGKRLRSFVITSASPAETKSSTVVALGLTLAETGVRVLLVDADLRHPSLADITQLEGAVGLTNVLIGEVALGDAAQRWTSDDLWVLTAGAVAPNPSQLIASNAMAAFIEHALGTYDIVIVDSAPLLSVTDAKWLGNVTDGAIVVTRFNRTSTRAFTRLIDAVEGAKVPLLGIVIARMPRRVRTRYGDSTYERDSTAAPAGRSRKSSVST